jgi:hypothetical protein
MDQVRQDVGGATLTFINVCFAVAVASLLVVMQSSLMDPWPKFWWVLLGASIIFILWKQYTNYEMPLQVTLGTHGHADWGDALSYAIAILVAAALMALPSSAESALWIMLGMIVLSCGKIGHMASRVPNSCRDPAKVRKVLGKRFLGAGASTLLMAVALFVARHCFKWDVAKSQNAARVPVLLIACYIFYGFSLYLPVLRKPDVVEYWEAVEKKPQ